MFGTDNDVHVAIRMAATMVGTLCLIQWGIPWLRKTFPRPVWKYPTTTPDAVLLKHHRRATWIVYALFVSITGMVSSIIEGLTFSESSVPFMAALFYLVMCAILILPGILAGAWIEEAEREFRERRIPPPGYEDIRTKVKRHVFALLLWIILAAAAPWITNGILKTGS